MKTNIILTVIALGLAYPCWRTFDAERVEDFRNYEEIPLLFPGFSPSLVRFIQLERKKPEEQLANLPPDQHFDRLVFERIDTGWVLRNSAQFDGLELDPDLIDRDILDHISALRLDKETVVPEEQVDEQFRTENQLTKETGIFITCLRDPQTRIVELILGKSTKQGKTGEAIHGYYVRDANKSKEVVLYEPPNRYWDLKLRESDWAKKKIHQFLMSDVATFYLRNAMGSAGFKRKAGSEQTWEPIPEQCPKDVGAVRQGEVSNLVPHFLSVEAQSFKRVKIEADKAKDGVRVEVRATLRSGEEYVLWIGREVPGQPESFAVSNVNRFQFGMANFHITPFRDQNPAKLFDPK